MSTKDLITSGVLELYALGLCSDEERRRVEDALTQDSSLRQEYEEICDALDSLAIDSAKEPPADLKSKVLAGLDEVDTSAGEATSEAEPKLKASKSEPQAHGQRRRKSKSSSSVPVIDLKRWQWSAAASFVLLAVSIGMNANYYVKWQGAEEQVSVLLQDKMLLSDDLGTYKTRYQGIQEDLAFFQRDGIESLTLGATDSFPEHEAIVFWDKKKGDVRMVANSLPELEEDYQYQLWALDNGTPVGAGLVPQNIEKGKILSMSNISSSQAFAITIEKKGGAQSPTLEKMVVIGKI